TLVQTSAERRHGAAVARGARPKLSIGMFGNMNNYPLVLAEGFRSLGHDVRLAVNRQEELHRPESKIHQFRKSYPDWILDCSVLTEEAIAHGTAPLLGRLLDYFNDESDLVVLNDFGPMLSSSLGKPQLAFLTGSDLTYNANYQSVDVRTACWDQAFRESPRGRRQIEQYSAAVCRHRDGILAADLVSFGLRGLIPEGDALLDSIGVPDARRTMIMLADTLRLNRKRPAANDRLRIFNGARITWQQTPDRRFSQQDLKGTDVLLHGFAEYCRRGGQGELRLVRKGFDVERAEQLCGELAIAGRVVWLPEMDLKRFLEEVVAADLVCDQLGQSFPGMVTSDACALGRPVLANLRNEIFGRRYDEPIPGFDARTPDEVARHLLQLEADREAGVAVGLAGRRFAERNWSPTAVAGEILRRLGLLDH
ncbi:MAG TPA: hypothetical protein VMB75_01045, partial [Rhodocyclaceae bacterium]|nr:hypothetical protein [Rhodocyclaceae bacterium]